MELRVVTIAIVTACSGKAKPADDARSAQRAEAKPTEAREPREVRVDPSGKGDVQVRIEWKDVPAAARTSPGRNACGDRAAAVSPTTTWGIPDAFVELSGAPAGAGSAKRIVVDACAPSPRAVAGRALTIGTTAQLPLKLSLVQLGALPLGGPLKPAAPHDIYLPIAGHEVVPTLEADAIYSLGLGEEQASIIASDSALLGVTDASGQVILRDVPSGTHAITAWLPARSGQPARVGKGKVNVAPGALTEVTVDLTTP